MEIFLLTRLLLIIAVLLNTSLTQVFSQSVEYPANFNASVDFILAEIDRENIANILRNLTLRQHLAGTPPEWDNARYVADTWRSQGLDEVHLVPYEVLLSYPEEDFPNYVRLHSPDDAEVFKTQGFTKPLFADEEFSDEILPDFNAYSAPGNISGSIVFAHYGRKTDFDMLENDLGVSVEGRIVIAKYGATFRANIVKSAQERGAIGIILYPDPQQYAEDGRDSVYPDTVFMPGSAAALGTTYVDDGDPLTPLYPSIESAFRIPEEESTVPKIPVMPISYDDAEVILRNMGGPDAPLVWQGALNLTYKLGPGLQEPGYYVSMEVNTHNQKSTIYDVIGMIRGVEEPDRYVIFGNHRDAWIFGAVDPSSGTAAMLELTRTLSEYRSSTGWAPRRTMVFCSWGAEEYGLIGSQEWTEQFGKQLSDRAIAYLNLDMAINGNATLRTKASPLLYTISIEITKLIPNPNPEEILAGRTTVYDTWVFQNPDSSRPGVPRFSGLGSGSDYKGFQHNLGIPSLDYRYTHSSDMFAEPLYHTLYETFFLVSELYDRGFNFHASISEMWGLLGVFLADSQIIPFSLDEYALFIEDAQQSLLEDYGNLIDSRNISMQYFRNASIEFTQQAQNFQDILIDVDKTNPLSVRRINDQLMMVERAFIDPQGLPGRPNYNHVVFAPSENNNYGATAFAGLSDALDGIEDLPPYEQEEHWRTFEEHLAVCTHLLTTASKVLSDDLWP